TSTSSNGIEGCKPAFVCIVTFSPRYALIAFRFSCHQRESAAYSTSAHGASAECPFVSIAWLLTAIVFTLDARTTSQTSRDIDGPEASTATTAPSHIRTGFANSLMPSPGRASALADR